MTVGSDRSIANRVARVAFRIPTVLIKTLKTLGAPSSSPSPPRSLLGKIYGWPPPSSNRETTWLDGLRGIAAFLVMSLHYNIQFLGIDSEAPFGSVLNSQGGSTTYAIWRLPFLRLFVASGHAQVSVFFVLSGFVLSWNSFGAIRHAGTGESKILARLSSSAFRRWMRLYLPCFIVGLLPFLEMWLSIEKMQGVGYASNIFLQFWDYIKACEQFSRPWIRDRKFPNWIHKYNWTMWTIPLEFEGSLLVFVLLLVLARMRSYFKRTALLSVLAFYAAVTGYWVYWLFTTGMLVADYMKEAGGFAQLSDSTTTRSRIIWWLVFLLGLYLAGLPTPQPYYTRPGYMFLDHITPSACQADEKGARFWWSVSGILIIFSGCHLRPVQKVCESAIARYLGRISFMLYLTHTSISTHLVKAYREWFFVVWGQNVLLKNWNQDVHKISFFAGIVLFLTSWILILIPSILIAYWCEIYVDAPSLRFARWVEAQVVDGDSKTVTTGVSDRQPVIPALEQENATSLPIYTIPHSD